MFSLCLFLRGLLDYKKEVYKYWPEFAQNGKSSITVEMLLSHQVNNEEGRWEDECWWLEQWLWWR